MNIKCFVLAVIFGLLGLVLALLLWLGGALPGVQAASTLPNAASFTVCLLGPPYCDYAVIQDAVDAASDGDVIKVAGGTYIDVHARAVPDGSGGTSVITQVVHISKTLTIRGGYTAFDFAEPPDPAAYTTTLDAEGQGRVIYVTGNAHLALEGLRLTGGTSRSGGGTYNEGALALHNCIIHRNRAAGGDSFGFGGGIYNDGALTIQDSLIGSNYAAGGSYWGYGENAHGGGIYNTVSGTVTIQDTALRGNSAGGSGGLAGGSGWGGGIYNEGMLVIRHSEIDSNGASGGYGVFSASGDGVGGGIFISASGSAVIEDSILSENAVDGGWGEPGVEAGWGSGGGIDNRGSLIIRRSVVRGNSASGGDGDIAGDAYGGGIDNRGTLIVESTTLSGNRALGGEADEGQEGSARGGAIGNSGTLTMDNSTLSGNSAGDPTGDGHGGGLYTGGETVKMSSCTIALNSAGGAGGGLYGTGGDNSGPFIKNTLIGDNTAPAGPDIGGNVQSRGYNLIEDTSGGTLDVDGNGNTAEGNITGQDPRLGPLQYNGGSGTGSTQATQTHALLDAPDPSPAIDAGSSTDVDGNPVAVDQRGFGRPCPAGGEHDIGAYERGAVDLFIVKDVVPGNAMPGDGVIYTLVFGNDSDMVATGIVISDTVPPSVTVTNVVSHGLALTGTSTGPIYAWDVENLLPGDSGVITISGELSALAAPGRITNTAVITTTSAEGKPANNSGTAVLRSVTRLYMPVVFVK